jgi:hypothetical protein
MNQLAQLITDVISNLEMPGHFNFGGKFVGKVSI